MEEIYKKNSRKIAKNTLLLYLRMLFTMIVALYTSRVVLNTLGVEDFGIYNVVGGIVAMFSFLNSAMAGASQRYLTFTLGQNNFEQLKKIFNTSINVHAIISSIILLLAETVGLWFLSNKMVIPENRFDAALWVYQCSVLSCIVMIMSVPYNAVIIAHEKMSAFAYISIIEVSLKLIIIYILTIGDFDKLKLYAVLMLFIQILIRLIYGNYCKRNFIESKYQFVFDKSLLKEMTVYAGWSMFGNIAFISFTQGINLLLNIFFGPTINAARGIAVQTQSAILGFSQNFQTALNPQITKSYASQNLDYMHNLVYKSSKYSYFLLFLLSLPILIEINQILNWWLGVVPEYTGTFIRIILCTSMLDSMAGSLMVAVQATGNIKIYQIIIGSILLLILPFSYLALRLGAPAESVFIIHFFCAIIAQIVRLKIISPMIGLSIKKYLNEVFLKISFVSIFSVLLPLICYIYLPQNIMRFIFVLICSFISTSCCIYIFGLNKNERFFVVDKFKYYYNKLVKK